MCTYFCLFIYLCICIFCYITSIIDLEWIRHLVNDSPPASSNKRSGHCTGPRRSSRWRRYSRRSVKPRKSWSSLRSSGSKPGSGDGFFLVELQDVLESQLFEKNIVNSHGAKVVYINVHAHTTLYILHFIYIYILHTHTTYGIFEIKVRPYIWLNILGTSVSMNYDISIQWGWFSHLHDWFSTHKLIRLAWEIPTPIEGEGGGDKTNLSNSTFFLLGNPGIVIQLLKWNFKVTFLYKPMCIHVLSSSFHLHACSFHFAFMSFHFQGYGNGSMAWPGDQVQQMVIAKLSLNNPSNIWHCLKEICHKNDRERERVREREKESEPVGCQMIW